MASYLYSVIWGYALTFSYMYLDCYIVIVMGFINGYLYLYCGNFEHGIVVKY